MKIALNLEAYIVKSAITVYLYRITWQLFVYHWYGVRTIRNVCEQYDYFELY